MNRSYKCEKKRIIIISIILLTSMLLTPVMGASACLCEINSDGLENSQVLLAGGNIYFPIIQGKTRPVETVGWPMVAANPERTSWTSEEVSGNLRVEWYRPIEAYIPQNVQVIASYGLLYISTSRGLYALDADTGDLIWRYDTELPLGNSPTVSDGIVYVGGYDRKLHALDAISGEHLWAFAGAQAGYDTNPLVVDGKVIAGNRDGNMYAVGAYGTPQQGQLVWKFETGGPIHLSAAARNGIVYFASNDNYAYALRIVNGDLVWKSQQLTGDGYQSYWPVIYQDKVIFSGASGYRMGLEPGTRSVKIGDDYGYEKTFDLDRDSIWPYDPDGTLIGSEVPDQEWAHGFPVLETSRITEYFENNPTPDLFKHKPWRRVLIALNVDSGIEYTFDSDGDGYPEYIPITMWGTHSGNRYPPIVGPDNILYVQSIYQKSSIPQGRIMGWNRDFPSYLSVLRSQGAIDEPQAISGGGNMIYRSISSDRVGDWFSITDPYLRGNWWGYDSPLFEQAPGYDDMMWILDPNDPDRMYGNYGNINGLYFQGGDQNPIIPYQGRVFTHRSNAIIAYGSGIGIGKLPLLEINSKEDIIETPTTDELKSILENEIQKIISAGHLRPGYVSMGQFGIFSELADYFSNPGDTLYTLALAYPHLSLTTQTQVKQYLKEEFQAYFDPIMYSTIGWADGAARESMPLPVDVEDDLSLLIPQQIAEPRWSWRYPQHNFYAMWKYAQIFPEDVIKIYDLAKRKIEVPVPDRATDAYLLEKTWELNTYISGYIGFLELQELAGKSDDDYQLYTDVTNELNRLLQLRINNFTKDTPWYDLQTIHKRYFNVSRNFMYIVPELGDYLYQNIYSQIKEAVDEYNFVAPYWFVSRYEAVHDEGVLSPLYNYQAMFQAKAYILKENRAELTKYLDVPAFERGDLFYIQNLIAAIEAP